MRCLSTRLCISLFAVGLTNCGSGSGPATRGLDSGSATGLDSGGLDSAVAIESSFATSACKKASKALANADLRSLKVIQDEAGLAGLRCVAWQRLANELLLDLYNFDGACGAQWTGSWAVAADGTLALDINNPSCSATACGVCLYDWSFDLKLSVASGAAVPVTIAVAPCESTVVTSTWSELIGSEEHGVHCVFADYTALSLQAGATGTRGESGMPCVGAAETCADGLVCASGAAANQRLCLVPCNTDLDCPRTDAWSCQLGLCKPRS